MNYAQSRLHPLACESSFGRCLTKRCLFFILLNQPVNDWCAGFCQIQKLLRHVIKKCAILVHFPKHVRLPPIACRRFHGYGCIPPRLNKASSWVIFLYGLQPSAHSYSTAIDILYSSAMLPTWIRTMPSWLRP